MASERAVTNPIYVDCVDAAGLLSQRPSSHFWSSSALTIGPQLGLDGYIDQLLALGVKQVVVTVGCTKPRSSIISGRGGGGKTWSTRRWSGSRGMHSVRLMEPIGDIPPAEYAARYHHA